jgi:hypothetical protein
VRLLAEAHEHFTDVEPFFHHLCEPELLGVVPGPQVIGACIREVIPVLPDDPEIRERPQVLVKDLESRLQGSRLDDFIPGVRLGNELKLGAVLV